MRSIWSALVVLVLLAPFGAVGITATPLDAEIVTAPRGPAASLEKPRIVECVPVLVVAPVCPVPQRVVLRHAVVSSPTSQIVTDRHPPAGPRDPPA
jgi:hypothetical protein